MKILAPEIDSVVSDKTDIFSRDEFGDGVLSVFERSDDPLVVVLDEPWGAGKTVFVRRLATRAETRGFKVVYFDAFKHDYDPDVFVSLASQILDSQKLKPKEKWLLKEKAKDVAKIVGKVALKGIIRGVTAGAVKLADLNEAKEEVATEIGDQIEDELDAIIDKRLASAKSEANAFDSFRKTLSKIASDEKGNGPLIFIVDELDRCKPNYALSVIETIKHFFSVKNVHFLIVCQMDQLAAVTRSVYGSDIDAKLYLEKFIHFRITFPAIDERDGKRKISTFAAAILRDMPDDDESGQFKSGFVDFISDLYFRKTYSLRKIERLCTLFGLCLAFTNKRTIRYPAIIHILCDLKISHPKEFTMAKNGLLTYKIVRDLYDFPSNIDSYDKMSWYARNWQYYLASEEDIKTMDTSGFNSHRFEYNIERLRVVPFIANQIVERFSFPK